LAGTQDNPVSAATADDVVNESIRTYTEAVKAVRRALDNVEYGFVLSYTAVDTPFRNFPGGAR